MEMTFGFPVTTSRFSEITEKQRLLREHGAKSDRMALLATFA
jgi:hypothetical protein